MGANEKKINCFRCVYYETTWQAKFPRACRIFGFKSARIPSVEIARTTGEQCPYFEEKKRKK